jgi:hypothetical protein
VRAPTTTDTNPTTTTRTADGRSGSAWGRSTRPSAARGRGLAEAETQPVLLEAVIAQRLDGEWWQGEDGVAGRGLERPTANSLRTPPTPAPPLPSASSERTVGSMTVSACRNWTVPASRSRSAHSRPHSSPLRARSLPQVLLVGGKPGEWLAAARRLC